METNMSKGREHTLNLRDRKVLTLSGVKDVGNFNDECVTVILDSGELVVKGSGLHISKLSVSTGELLIDGNISSLIYTQNNIGGGFFKKLFK
ncbi:MAG: sporulation protein YabP [Clostridiales bacterium]|nr:sporulation protein YabP [Clostridiales bacterium]